MEVREIFALRKAGHIEEAYDQIREKYKNYHGHYTSLCMFWCASDVAELRVEEGRMDEAKQILLALERMLPNLPDEDSIGNRMSYLRKLIKDKNNQ